MKVAWIGTGVMGKPMALHLSDAGHEVFAYNRTFEKAKALEPKVKAFDSIESCIKDAEVIFTIVGYPSDVEEVYEDIIEKAKKGTILVDMTTSSPTLAFYLYQKASEKGLKMLDAPVTGGDLGAIKGTLSIMVGGDEEVFNKVLPLFKLMGTTITYMGAAGSGMHAKLANQTVIAGNIMGIAEALVYAKEKNLDVNKMLSVIVGGSASSWQAANNGPKMIDNDYKPGFYVKHFLKDLKLAMEEKGELPLIVLEKVTQAYQTLLENGFSEQGTQSIIEYYLQKMM
ncbi:MAG: NAD(P)-dependent oxidoreductase [Tenericutes bacterium]|jgi:3-hydroxyisobutyrate dehydrogenase|nr:NAD(P)-dependent oxidoreductase [Mycoplasmatota bacterium]